VALDGSEKALVNMVLNFKIPDNVENSLTLKYTATFSLLAKK
jgi:hypothetical protein